MNLRTLFLVALLLPMTGFAKNRDIRPSTSDLPPHLAVGVEKYEALPAVQAMIEATEGNLAQQQALKELLESYQVREQEYLKNPNDSSRVWGLVSTARDIQSIIDNQNLTHLFSDDQLSEFALFSKIASKQQ